MSVDGDKDKADPMGVRRCKDCRHFTDRRGPTGICRMSAHGELVLSRESSCDLWSARAGAPDVSELLNAIEALNVSVAAARRSGLIVTLDVVDQLGGGRLTMSVSRHLGSTV